MNKYHQIREPRGGSVITLWSAPAGNGWESWIIGKALPLCVWMFFLVVILFSVIADARRMSHEGASLESLLLLARAGLTGAFMVLLASLASLPEDIYEAARLDRATAWQRFRRITLPLLRPAIVMVVIMRTMGALTAFAAIFTVTGGGPGTATEILNLYAYRKSFTELSIGYGSALAVALLIVTILISGVLFALRRAK